ncbi:MAG: GldG family protein, partial [Thermoanaerobaculia bacterium]|nr:GldG family protein [Thermoanaerobaculia bacterium]
MSATNERPTPVGSRTKRAAVEGSIWGAGVLLVLALAGILNYFGMKYYQRWDWTGESLYTLSEKSLAVLAGLDQDVEVTMFLQPGGQLYDPAKELLERYAARSPRVSLRTVDPQRNLIEAQRLVDELQLSSLNVVVFESGGDRRVVEESTLAEFDYSGMQFGAAPTMTGFKGEEAFTSAILALVEKTKPKVLFTTGHGERSLDDFDEAGLSRIRDLLGKENLELEGWASLGQGEVPTGTDLLVVAGPRVNFVAPELAA